MKGADRNCHASAVLLSSSFIYLHRKGDRLNILRTLFHGSFIDAIGGACHPFFQFHHTKQALHDRESSHVLPYSIPLPCERGQCDVNPAEPLDHKDAVAVQPQTSLPPREGVERHQQKRRLPAQHHHRHLGGNNEAVLPSDSRTQQPSGDEPETRRR